MKAIFPVFLGLALLTVPGCNRQRKSADTKPPAPISVEVATVSTRDVQRVMEAVGSMFPFEEVVISAEIEGRVDEVKVDLGDRVTEGQVLVRLSDEEQQYVLAQNEAQLRQSLVRLGLKDEEDRVEDVREAAEVRRVQAELSELELRQKRIQELVDQGIGSRQELDQVQARFKAVQAEYDATINQAQNLIQEVERYKAHVQFQRKKLRDTTIRAPFSASVKERTVTVGEYVRPNAPLITLVKTDPVRLRRTDRRARA